MPRRGTEEERRAARHYRLRGYRILGTNVWAGGYELDLIARRGRRLVFCEVKGKVGARLRRPARDGGRGEAAAAPPGGGGLARPQRVVPRARVPLRGRRGARRPRARRGLTLRQHVPTARRLRFGPPEGTIPNGRARQTARPGAPATESKEPGREKLPAESKPRQHSAGKDDRKHHVDHTHQVRDPGPRTWVIIAGLGALFIGLGGLFGGSNGDHPVRRDRRPLQPRHVLVLGEVRPQGEQGAARRTAARRRSSTARSRRSRGPGRRRRPPST